MPLGLRREEYKRLIDIAIKATRHGFGFVIGELGLEKYLPKSYRRLELLISSKKELPQKFRELLEDLGPTFVKIGQVLSVRPDLLPLEYIEELEKLQDRVPPFEFEKVKEIIQAELHKPLEEVFDEFEENPVASASIAQVHRATLKNGEKVAVKIQRPEAAGIIESDLRILRYIAELASKRIETVDLIGIWEELATTLRNELDFRVEAQNIQEFLKFFENDEIIKIPHVYPDFTTSRVLTMEYVEGKLLSQIEEIEAEYEDVDTEALAIYGARAFMKQVLEIGVFHADLHPANLMVTPDGKICYLDFGMVGRLSLEERRAIVRMLYAQIFKDVDEIIFQSEILGVRIPRGKIPLLRTELKSILDRYYARTLGEIRIDIIGHEFVQLLYRNRIRIPRSYALLVKALITVEGVAQTLYPQINVLEVARPYVEELVRKYYPPTNYLKELADTLIENSYVLFRLPRKIENVISVLEGAEETRIDEIQAIKDLSRTIKETGFLLAVSFMSAFIAIGLAILSLAIPAGGITTFLISVIFFLIAGSLLIFILLRLFIRR